jgi:hypothetical protein
MLDERSKELLREFGKINSEDVRGELTGSHDATNHHGGHGGHGG